MTNTKMCSKCKKIKDLTHFTVNNRYKDKVDGWCKQCKAEAAKDYYWKNVEIRREYAREYSRTHKMETKERHLRNPEKTLCIWAKARAKKEGVYFNIQPTDIHVPEFCPVLGIRLEFSKAGVPGGL